MDQVDRGTPIVVPTSPYGTPSVGSSLAESLGGSILLNMTKSQQRELKTILAVIGRVLSPESHDDVVRLLLYRAQTLADGACANTAHAPVHKTG